MFAEYGTANSPLTKTIAVCYEYRGRPELQTRHDKRKKVLRSSEGFQGNCTRPGWCGALVTRNVVRMFPCKQELAEQFYKTARVSMETCALRGRMKFSIRTIHAGPSKEILKAFSIVEKRRDLYSP